MKINWLLIGFLLYRWRIRVRVTQKGQMREWKNARGEGKLFSFTVIDDSGEIRVTCFKDEAERFYDLIEVGKVSGSKIFLIGNKLFESLFNFAYLIISVTYLIKFIT